jgi:uroporphyrinogen decarboxylase
MDYWGTPEVSAKLIRHFGLSDKSIKEIVVDLGVSRFLQSESDQAVPDSKLLEREVFKQLNIDFVVRLENRYVGPSVLPGSDPFGCQYRLIEYDDGSYIECSYNPLGEFDSVEEIEKDYTWPDPDWWDYSTIAKQINGYEDYPIRAGGSEPFLFYKYLRGDEKAFLDLMLKPEIVHYILEKLFGLAFENTKRMYESIPEPEDKLILTYVNEDLGSQNGLLYSPKHIREFLLPRMEKMISFAHENNAYVFHHDDGSIRKILPDLIDAGIDILNPIQWGLKDMDREGLKRDFGEQVIFHGAVDNQYTLPFGSVDEVRNEVVENIEILGKGGGYIIAPCHNIQPNTTVENILALYETGYKYGWQG